MLGFKKLAEGDQESTNAAGKEGCERQGETQNTVFLQKLMVECFRKEKRSTGQMPQSSNHRSTGNCPCNFGSPEDI